MVCCRHRVWEQGTTGRGWLLHSNMLTTFLVLCATLSVRAAANGTAEPPTLTPCQQCAQPGGDCTRAYKGGYGVHCGDIFGKSFCCPAQGSACYRHGAEYRCRVFDEDADLGDGGLLVIIMMFVLVACAISRCARLHQQRRQVPLAAHQGHPISPAAVEMTTVTGVPLGTTTAHSGMAVATATPVVGQPVPACGNAVRAQVQPTFVHHHHPHYGYGYGGGSVAMGASMGFLGGMMLADVGDHGYGGDMGGGGGFGGGDFAADM